MWILILLHQGLLVSLVEKSPVAACIQTDCGIEGAVEGKMANSRSESNDPTVCGRGGDGAREGRGLRDFSESQRHPTPGGGGALALGSQPAAGSQPATFFPDPGLPSLYCLSLERGNF